jgi:hypothetical protein
VLRPVRVAPCARGVLVVKGRPTLVPLRPRAEAEDRQVLKLEEKVLGPEHPNTPVCAAAGASWLLAPLLVIS